MGKTRLLGVWSFVSMLVLAMGCCSVTSPDSMMGVSDMGEIKDARIGTPYAISPVHADYAMTLLEVQKLDFYYAGGCVDCDADERLIMAKIRFSMAGNPDNRTDSRLIMPSAYATMTDGNTCGYIGAGAPDHYYPNYTILRPTLTLMAGETQEGWYPLMCEHNISQRFDLTVRYVAVGQVTGVKSQGSMIYPLDSSMMKHVRVRSGEGVQTN